MQRLIEERLICFQISGLHLIPDLGISSLAIGLAHAYRQRVVTGVTAEGLYQLRLELELTCTFFTDDAKDDRVFLQELVKCTGRNSIRVMLADFEFLALGHHVLYNRESECSLAFDSHLRVTREVNQVSYRFHFLVHVTNFVYLLLLDDIPRSIYILLIETIPLQRNQIQAISINCIKCLNRQNLSPEVNRSRTLEIYVNYAIRQHIKCAVLNTDRFALSTGSQREVLNGRSLIYRA